MVQNGVPNSSEQIALPTTRNELPFTISMLPDTARAEFKQKLTEALLYEPAVDFFRHLRCSALRHYFSRSINREDISTINSVTSFVDLMFSNVFSHTFIKLVQQKRDLPFQVANYTDVVRILTLFANNLPITDDEAVMYREILLKAYDAAYADDDETARYKYDAEFY